MEHANTIDIAGLVVKMTGVLSPDLGVIPATMKAMGLPEMAMKICDRLLQSREEREAEKRMHIEVFRHRERGYRAAINMSLLGKYIQMQNAIELEWHRNAPSLVNSIGEHFVVFSKIMSKRMDLLMENWDKAQDRLNRSPFRDELSPILYQHYKEEFLWTLSTERRGKLILSHLDDQVRSRMVSGPQLLQLQNFLHEFVLISN